MKKNIILMILVSLIIFSLNNITVRAEEVDCGAVYRGYENDIDDIVDWYNIRIDEMKAKGFLDKVWSQLKTVSDVIWLDKMSILGFKILYDKNCDSPKKKDAILKKIVEINENLNKPVQDLVPIEKIDRADLTASYADPIEELIDEDYLNKIKSYDCEKVKAEVNAKLSYYNSLVSLDDPTKGDQYTKHKYNECMDYDRMLEYKRLAEAGDVDAQGIIANHPYIKAEIKYDLLDSYNQNLKVQLDKIKGGASKTCKDILSGLNSILKNYYAILIAVAVVILVAFSIGDFVKATISGEAEANKKAFKTFGKRLLILVFLFALVLIIRLIVENVGFGFELDLCDVF